MLKGACAMSRRILLSLCIFALFAVGVASCASYAQAPPQSAESARIAAGEESGGMIYAATPSPAATAAAPGSRTQTQPQERMVIRNATLTMTMEDVAGHLDRIRALAAEYGGWVVSSNAQRASGANSEITSATITIRVPADRFDEALIVIRAGVGSVDNETITGEDVTQQYVDLTSQLTNLTAAEEQLQVIMDEADETEDVLAVYNELVRIRGEIERIRGQMQYYEQSAAFSAINVTLRRTPTPIVINSPTWQPLSTAENAFQALIKVMQGIIDLLIGLVIFVLPMLLVFGVPLWLIIRRARRPQPKT